MPIIPIPDTSYELRDLTLAHQAQVEKIVRKPGFYFALFQGNKAPHWSDDPIENIRTYLMIAEWQAKSEKNERTSYIMGVFKENTDMLIGMTVLVKIDPKDPSFEGKDLSKALELGYFIDPDYQGQGLSGKASQTIIDWAKNNIGLKTVYAQADPTNAPSCRTIQKLNFEQIAALPKSDFLTKDGQPAGRLIFSRAA
jgi:RimJ/RimL family protein N-acetyltransferase